MKTAEEFLKEGAQHPNGWTAKKCMIEFAKMHVKEALKSQGKLVKRCVSNKSPIPSLEFLATSYPLENIK